LIEEKNKILSLKSCSVLYQKSKRFIFKTLALKNSNLCQKFFGKLFFVLGLSFFIKKT
jgi:hypothetical protein